MTQSDHSARRTPRRTARRAPARRGDSTRPASTRTDTRSITRRGGHRRPYPTAPTTTRVSPAKPGSAGSRARSRGSSSVPIPATVWALGPAPIDLDVAWPTAVVSKIVGSFSEPGGRVALVPWPTPEPPALPTSGDRPRLAPVGSDGVIDSPIATPPGVDPDDDVATDVAAALATIEGRGRTGRVVRLAPDPTDTGPGSRPFWADLVTSPDPATTTSATASAAASGVGGRASDGPNDVPAECINSTDLIITSLCPEHRDHIAGDHASDRVALLAAQLLRVGGVLAVLTHSDWPLGELIDPTGAVVASAQNADLLYLQHIVALHAPVRDGRFATETHAESHAESLAELTSAAAEERARVRHRASVRGLPTPHRRIHSDVLVFAQPHDYEPPRLAAADAAFETGVIR